MEGANVQVDHHLEIDDQNHFRCRRCGHDLGSAERNFKEGAVKKVRPIQAANPLIADPDNFIDDPVEFRQYYCPGCATLLENEVIRSDSATVWDKQLSIDAPASGG